MKPWKRFVLAPVAVLAIGGCASRTDIEPAETAQKAPGLAEAAVSQVAGVRITARAPDQWPGQAKIMDQVEPMKVTIENGGDQPIQIQYPEFQLVGPQGEVFSALPPFRIGGPAESPVLEGRYAPLTAPDIAFDGFGIAPVYAPIYPGVPVAPTPFLADPVYYGRTYGVLAERNLPTPEMLSRALPEGILQPGGKLEGYLYFEKVGEGVPSVIFRADLVGAGQGERLGTLSIPFSVQGEGSTGS
jgi:hypothetical protein